MARDTIRLELERAERIDAGDQPRQSRQWTSCTILAECALARISENRTRREGVTATGKRRMVDGECRVLREQCSLGAGNPRASAEARSASLFFSGRRL